MRQTTGTRKSPGEKLVKDIKRCHIYNPHYLVWIFCSSTTWQLITTLLWYRLNSPCLCDTPYETLSKRHSSGSIVSIACSTTDTMLVSYKP